jgi:hypothetical protein
MHPLDYVLPFTGDLIKFYLWPYGWVKVWLELAPLSVILPSVNGSTYGVLIPIRSGST